MILILSGLRRKPGRGFPFLEPFPGDGGRESPVSCLLLLEVPATRLAAKRLRRQEGRCGGGTGVPGRLPASIGSTCCPPSRLVASAAGGCRCHKSLRLPCVKGAGARRATEGLSAETSPEALSPGNISPPDCRVPSGPMQAAGAENASPQCLPLPPFRGRLPGGRGMASHFLSSNGRGSGEFRRTLCRSAPSCRVSLRRAERIKEILISP